MKSQISTLVSWSSGKDSAWALHLSEQSEECKIVGPLTTLNSVFDRVAMHNTRREVLEAQVAAAGLPYGLFRCPGRAPIEGGEVVEREGFVFCDVRLMK
jgi:diphthamide synthase (EF-2-diphthine--ammonia ligase)